MSARSEQMGSATGIWGLQLGSFGLLRHLFRFVASPHGDSEEIRHLVSQEFHFRRPSPQRAFRHDIAGFIQA
jgi:hypothetical protein